jgi:hypothetical protein
MDLMKTGDYCELKLRLIDEERLYKGRKKEKERDA